MTGLLDGLDCAPGGFQWITHVEIALFLLPTYLSDASLTSQVFRK